MVLVWVPVAHFQVSLGTGLIFWTCDNLQLESPINVNQIWSYWRCRDHQKSLKRAVRTENAIIIIKEKSINISIQMLIYSLQFKAHLPHFKIATPAHRPKFKLDHLLNIACRQSDWHQPLMRKIVIMSIMNTLSQHVHTVWHFYSQSFLYTHIVSLWFFFLQHT